ncbi:MAG: hypothetical protein KDB02_03450, partial [Acidimicrobiales bacterium]|nr:hypothetical protein [Acidimicrobiales bacterium]
DGGVLFVDQLEEVVTRGGPVAVREEFLRRVLLPETGGPRIVIATLRADVLGAVVAVPGVAEVLDRATLLVPPMSATEMRAAIEQPAAAVGLRLESGLTELVLADVAAQPGSLPLASHAMYETWLRRRGNTLTVAAYREAGGVDGAVARTADSVHLGQFDEIERGVARSLLLALVEPGEGTDDSRRSATAAELMGSGVSGGRQDQVRVERVLETLVSARLLSVDGETVDLAHESLIRAWPRFRGWLDEDREALAVHRRLGRAAAEWQEGGCDDAELYRGGRLAAATDLSARGGVRLSPDEKAFLDASEALQDREVTAAAERAAADRRANRRLKVILGVGAVALLVAAAAAVVAIRERNKTQSLADAADARSAALQIEGVAVGDPSLARLVAAEAYYLSPGPETTRSLFEAVTADGRVTATIELPAASSPLLGVSTSGEVVSVQGNEVRRWRSGTGQLSGKVSLPEGSGEAFALSPDFSAVVTFPGTEDSADPTSTGVPDRVAVFGVDGKERWTAPLTVDATTLVSVPSATVSRGGDKVLLVGTASVALVGPDGAGPPIDLPAGEGIRTAAISPDGDRAAVAVAQAPDAFVETAAGPLASPAGPTDVLIVDTATGKGIRTIAAGSPVDALLFSPDGSNLAVGTVPSQPPMVSLDPKAIPDVGTATTFTVDVATGRRLDKEASAPGAPAAWVGTDLAVNDSTGWVSTWKPDLSEATGLPARYDATAASVAGDADVLLVGEATATRAQVTVRDRHRPHGVVTPPSGPPGLTQVAVSGGRYVVSVRPDPDQTYTGTVVTVNDGDKVVAEKKGSFGGVGGGHVLVDGRLLRLPDLKPVGNSSQNRLAGGRLSPDGKFVAVAADGSLRLRDARTGKDVTSISEIQTTVPPDPTIGPLTFSADGDRLLVRTELEQVAVFDLSSRSTVAEEAVAAGSDAISLSPDGSILAVGSLSGDVVLDDLDTSKPPTTLSGLGEAVGSISFLTGPDDESLVAVSGSDSNTTILFDVASGQQYGPALAVPVRQVAQNASELVLASSAGLMKIPMDVDRWRDTACATTGRTLTRAESNRYFPGRSTHGSCGS